MPILERKIIHDRTTLCSRILSPRFVLPRHKHAEYEIMLFTGGSGKQFVGEGVCDYKEGDIAMIGSNVPHLHLCNAKLNPTMGLEASAGVALQFHPTIFPCPWKNCRIIYPFTGCCRKASTEYVFTTKIYMKSYCNGSRSWKGWSTRPG